MTNQVIPEGAVEAAAKAFYNDPSGLTSWERATKASPVMADRYRAAMARALEAAAPHMRQAFFLEMNLRAVEQELKTPFR